MNKQLKSVCSLLLTLLLGVSLTACSIGYPEEINMADMGHDHHSAASAAGISCADMTEAPSNAPVKKFDLTATQTNGAWTFNGSTPGPELRVHEGERLVVKLTNKDIKDGVTIHWHGVVLPCSQDGVAGVTQDAVWPGESFTYEFVAKHPGTYWYHSHQQSSKQAKRGLIGRLIVEPQESAFRYDRDYAVTLQELNEEQKLTNGRKDGLHLDAEPGETVRLRLINAYNKVQYMGVAGAPFQVIAMDGQDLNGPDVIQNQWIPVGGGQRYDVLFTMPVQGQVKVYSRDETDWRISLGTGATPPQINEAAPLFDFTTYGTPLDDEITSEMNFDRTYDFTLGPVDINGEQGHDIPPILVKEGEWIKLRFTHRLGAEHPMHLHGHLFKILTKNGRPLTGSPIYADSVLLFKGDTYEVAFLANNPGLWMEHCHNLGHAAAGMMMMVNYEGVTTPYRVGTKSGNLPD